MADMRRLGKTGIEVSALGVGVWSWGDRGFWQYGTNYGRDDVNAAYNACLDEGLNFFDTAEIYGGGESERLLGECVRSVGKPVVIASKFAPLPFRITANSLFGALEASLMRLGITKLDLYQIHWPYSLLLINDLMDVLAQAVKSGKVRSVGVSNYTADQMRRAHKRLSRYGIPLASNQVHYSLLKRSPEVNGVLDACRELDVALIAYSPLEQGILTGKYATGQATPAGPRALAPAFWQARQSQYKPLLTVLQRIANEREKTSAQVALNWLLCRDELVIPIPGAKNERQARQNAGALNWRLNEQEINQIDQASRPWKK